MQALHQERGAIRGLFVLPIYTLTANSSALSLLVSQQQVQQGAHTSTPSLSTQARIELCNPWHSAAEASVLPIK